MQQTQREEYVKSKRSGTEQDTLSTAFNFFFHISGDGDNNIIKRRLDDTPTLKTEQERTRKKMSAKAEEMNRKMAKVAKELSSSFAKYPLKGETSTWLDPSTDNAFIAAKGEPEPLFKQDYVYGPGRLGRGYYHLLTIDSYKALYARLQNEAPFICCCFGTKVARQEASDHEDVLRIVYNRSVGSRPDDAIAAEDAIKIARGEARAYYQSSQNAQLLFMTI